MMKEFGPRLRKSGISAAAASSGASKFRAEPMILEGAGLAGFCFCESAESRADLLNDGKMEKWKNRNQHKEAASGSIWTNRLRVPDCGATSY